MPNSISSSTTSSTTDIMGRQLSSIESINKDPMFQKFNTVDSKSQSSKPSISTSIEGDAGLSGNECSYLYVYGGRC